ncbi:murein transglycosylase A [Aestuariivirga sp.]|uniref:murein transglycosylase A n=1 Tax=Aestuariivirga sp. TaxID=2650926 RepID=UPI0039E62555
MKRRSLLLSPAALWAMRKDMRAASPPILEAVPFTQLHGWAEDNHAEALAAFRRSCREIIDSGRAFSRPVAFGGERADWLPACEAAMMAADAKGFFETRFQALRVHDPLRPEGLFTGYYEPEALGSRTPSARFPAAIYRKPADLVMLDEAAQKRLGLKYGRVADGAPQGYFTRREIEQGALQGRGLEIVWLSSFVDAFFIQVQGSGRIRLEDGSVIHLAYAGKTGQPYTAIGGVLVERGVFNREEMSMQALRAWMAKDDQAARQLMWENKSFVFFREVDGDDPKLGPPGAQGVALTPRRSLAVDRSLWMFGAPVFLETQTPSGKSGALESFHHLLIAQDTGTAIRGHARGDVFWGAGEHAAETAGLMKSPGTFTVLLPKPLAARLLARP